MGASKARAAAWAGLVLALAGCGEDESGGGAAGNGAGVNTPLVWVDQSTTGAGVGADGETPLAWVDATTVTPTGGGAILPSTDEVTYSYPKVIIAGNTHPLLTNSGAAAILNPEDQLAQAINTYRLTTLGFNDVGGVGGLGGIGGVQPTLVMLPMSGKLRKAARAHCKHYGVAANNHPGALPLINAEKDNLIAGGVAPAGRLPKAGITTASASQFVISGAAYPTATSVIDYLIATNAAALTSTKFSHMGVGHWPAGPQKYYWNVVFALSPRPAN